MAIPVYNQVTSPEQNLLELLAAQVTPNPPIGQEAFAVLATKAILNLFAAETANTGSDFLQKANNLSDVANPLQALANIGGMQRSVFLESLAALSGGILVKRNDGTAAVRTLEVGAGLTVANPNGDAGNPTVGLGNRLAQVNAATLQDLWGFVYRDGVVMGMSLLAANFGAVPLAIAAGERYEVLANTQSPFSSPIDIDGELVVDGVLYSV
jgi:hypothetical protein